MLKKYMSKPKVKEVEEEAFNKLKLY